MSTIKFQSINAEVRTATFLVNDQPVTRPIADDITDETLGAHLQALALGLSVELEDEGLTDDDETEVESDEAEEMPVLSGTTAVASDEVIFEGTADEARAELEASVAEEKAPAEEIPAKEAVPADEKVV